MRARKMQNANARSTRRSFWHLYTGTFAFLIAQKHRCAASRIVSVRRCRRRRTALASCACASKQCSFSTADRSGWTNPKDGDVVCRGAPVKSLHLLTLNALCLNLARPCTAQRFCMRTSSLPVPPRPQAPSLVANARSPSSGSILLASASRRI